MGYSVAQPGNISPHPTYLAYFSPLTGFKGIPTTSNYKCSNEYGWVQVDLY